MIELSWLIFQNKIVRTHLTIKKEINLTEVNYSVCAARYQVIHGLVPVRSPGVGVMEPLS